MQKPMKPWTRSSHCRAVERSIITLYVHRADSRAPKRLDQTDFAVPGLPAYTYSWLSSRPPGLIHSKPCTHGFMSAPPWDWRPCTFGHLTEEGHSLRWDCATSGATVPVMAFAIAAVTATLWGSRTSLVLRTWNSSHLLWHKCVRGRWRPLVPRSVRRSRLIER